MQSSAEHLMVGEEEKGSRTQSLVYAEAAHRVDAQHSPRGNAQPQILAAHSQPLLKTRARQASAVYHKPLSFNVLAEHYTTFNQSSQNAVTWCLILTSYFIFRGKPYRSKRRTAEFSH